MTTLLSRLKNLSWRSRGSALGVLVLMVIAVQVLRFVRLGPQLAEVSAATMSQTAEKVVDNIPRDTSDLSEYRDLMQHTQQVAEKLTAPTTRPTETRPLAINPFRSMRIVIPADDHAALERSETLEAAQSLQLQSVMPSKLAPVCMIDNILLREKQQVEGFTVDQIKSDSVIVHRASYRFELRLLR